MAWSVWLQRVIDQVCFHCFGANLIAFDHMDLTFMRVGTAADNVYMFFGSNSQAGGVAAITTFQEAA